MRSARRRRTGAAVPSFVGGGEHDRPAASARSSRARPAPPRARAASRPTLGVDASTRRRRSTSGRSVCSCVDGVGARRASATSRSSRPPSTIDRRRRGWSRSASATSRLDVTTVAREVPAAAPARPAAPSSRRRSATSWSRAERGPRRAGPRSSPWRRSSSLEPFGEAPGCPGHRPHGAAVDAPQRAGRLELLRGRGASVSDRDAAAASASVRGDDAAVAVEAGEDRRLAFGGGIHATPTVAQTCTKPAETRRYLHESRCETRTQYVLPRARSACLGSRPTCLIAARSSPPRSSRSPYSPPRPPMPSRSPASRLTSRYPFQPGGPKSFGVFKLTVEGGKCTTAHRVAKAWMKAFEAEIDQGRVKLPKSVEERRVQDPARERGTDLPRARDQGQDDDPVRLPRAQRLAALEVQQRELRLRTRRPIASPRARRSRPRWPAPARASWRGACSTS